MQCLTCYVRRGSQRQNSQERVNKLTWLPCLQDVGLVKGLSANLISISQLCDHYFSVKFRKNRREVFNHKNKVILSGTRLSNNCYHSDSEIAICNLSKTDEAILWYKRLGHLGISTICKAIGVDIVLSIPMLKSNVMTFAVNVQLENKLRHHTRWEMQHFQSS